MNITHFLRFSLRREDLDIVGVNSESFFVIIPSLSSKRFNAFETFGVTEFSSAVNWLRSERSTFTLIGKQSVHLKLNY